MQLRARIFFELALAVGLEAASNKKSKVILYYTNYYTNDKRICLYTQSKSCHVLFHCFFSLCCAVWFVAEQIKIDKDKDR